MAAFIRGAAWLLILGGNAMASLPKYINTLSEDPITGLIRNERPLVVGAAPSGRWNYVLVMFDDGRLDERFIDPLAQLIDMDLYVDEINRALTEMTVVAAKAAHRKTAVDDRGHGNGGAPLA